MLLVLTGDIQIGKTRWLQASVDRLEAAGVGCEGVVAPGVWRPQAAPEGGYEKLGIDNLLLPEHELVPFARREDLARAEGTYDPTNGSAQLGLVWHIDEGAVCRVNAHFEALQARIDATPAAERLLCRRVLFVDELGRLELQRGGGLTAAMGLLARGPQGYYDHALVVARNAFGLNERVVERFGEAWGVPCRSVLARRPGTHGSPRSAAVHRIVDAS